MDRVTAEHLRNRWVEETEKIIARAKGHLEQRLRELDEKVASSREARIMEDGPVEYYRRKLAEETDKIRASSRIADRIKAKREEEKEPRTLAFRVQLLEEEAERVEGILFSLLATLTHPSNQESFMNDERCRAELFNIVHTYARQYKEVTGREVNWTGQGKADVGQCDVPSVRATRHQGQPAISTASAGKVAD